MSKKALVTGFTGQDGSYLVEFLLDKGYEICGFLRRKSSDPFSNFDDPNISSKIKLVYGNLRDEGTIERLFQNFVPDEIYNLAAQSHVDTSFVCPEETWDVNYNGLERLVRHAVLKNPNVKIYQASTSEMFGASQPPQNENTKFDPVSPYAEAKLKAHQSVVLKYRKENNVFICSGILFNHESPKRGKLFVTRKITFGLSKIKLGLQKHLELGNLDAKRDWGFAGDYVNLMWTMLQQEVPDDYVIATGEMYSVREFVNKVADYLDMPITWEGEGVDEIGKDSEGNIIIKVDKNLYRPVETSDLCGDSSKAQKVLGWKPKVGIDELVKMMVDFDLIEADFFKKKMEYINSR
ncbi:MAG: GDP-mannose 4,6-dehydratase [Candidatus Paceibacterota bacterium]